MKRTTFGVLTVMTVAVLTGSTWAQLLEPTGINPATGQPWADGDTYHWIYVTTGTTEATSTDIAEYNAFVQADAASNGMGDFNWFVMGSTAEVNAIDNAVITGPVINISNQAIVANDAADLWNLNFTTTSTPKTLSGENKNVHFGTVGGGTAHGGFTLGAAGGSVRIAWTGWTNWAAAWRGESTSDLKPLVAISEELTIGGGFKVTSITPDVDPAKLSLTWESQAGKRYDIVATTAPLADPQTWTPVVNDIATTPPENTEVFTKPVDPFTVFAVLEKPIPPLFFDDFESDLGWTVGVDGGTDTAWVRGTPSVVGPAAANSPVTCYGTNIDAAYGLDVNIYLRSPAIDLSAAITATLSFQQFYDIETGFDAGSVRVLKSSDLSQLGADVINPVEGTVTEWTEFTGALPPEALGETVILEFRFTSDGFAPSAQSGWYIDDVSVTVE